MEKLTPAQRRVVDALLHYKESKLRLHYNDQGTKCYSLVSEQGNPIMDFRVDVIGRLIEMDFIRNREIYGDSNSFGLNLAVDLLPDRYIAKSRKSPLINPKPLRKSKKKYIQQAFDFEKKKSRIYVQMPRGK